MKLIFKMLGGVALSLMCLFTGIGYAAVSDDLKIIGTAELAPPEEVFITNVELDEGSTTGTSVSYSYEFPRMLDTTVRFSARNQKVTYKVTLHNGTKYAYAFSKVDYLSDLNGYNNDLIGSIVTVTLQDANRQTLDKNDMIEPGQTIDVYVTYTLVSWRSNYRNVDIKTLVNIDFAINVDSLGAVFVDQTFKDFQNILNDSEGKYQYLLDILDDKYDNGGYNNQWQATYIGNVSGSSLDDTQKVEELFGSDLTLNIDGVESRITLLIKHEDVDGNVNTGDSYQAGSGSGLIRADGCEMTLYMTTDDLSNRYSTPTIYAASFTRNKNSDGTYGEWYMLGDMYTGTATIIGYNGETNMGGSFQTADWRSTGTNTYVANDNYSYTVTRNQTIQNIIQTVDTNANNELIRLITRANTIITEDKYSGQAIINLEAVMEQYAYYYTIDGSGNVSIVSGATRAQLVPAIKAFDVALEPFENLE